MEFSLSGNSIKIFARSIICLARIGTELVFQSSPSQLTLNTLNSSRSAFQSITFKQDFFDAYTVSGAEVKCSVLLKAICSVLRTPLSNIDHLAVLLSDSGASKVQWTLNCNSGMKKTYWVTCTIEPDFQHLSLDREKFPSSLVVRPRHLNRLLANFQSNLQEITVIATEPHEAPHDAIDQIGGKAVELRSYIDPTKENDSSLHTQLWIDPGEEFVQYTHSGHPVDVTFSVKELKAFLSFCESCEVDIHLYFEKAGEPILMVPKFGLDDGTGSNFDTTLVLATMLVSQIDAGNSSEPPPSANVGANPRQGAAGNNDQPSDHTKIWSELSGSAAKGGNNAESRRIPAVRNQSTREQTTFQKERAVNNISVDIAPELIRNPEECAYGRYNLHQKEQLLYFAGWLVHQHDFHYPETDAPTQQQLQPGDDARAASQRHPRNWVDADEDDDDTDDSELCIQSTPPHS